MIGERVKEKVGGCCEAEIYGFMEVPLTPENYSWLSIQTGI